MAITESDKKAKLKYLNKWYRPSILIDKDKRESIEDRIKQQGYSSINAYVNALIDDDLSKSI